jgi:hypothetical protein
MRRSGMGCVAAAHPWCLACCIWLRCCWRCAAWIDDLPHSGPAACSELVLRCRESHAWRPFSLDCPTRHV